MPLWTKYKDGMVLACECQAPRNAQTAPAERLIFLSVDVLLALSLAVPMVFQLYLGGQLMLQNFRSGIAQSPTK